MAQIAHEAALSANEPMLTGAGKLFFYLWNEAWRHAEATIAGDADALHDMRVAMRRLRTGLHNFEGPQSVGEDAASAPRLLPSHLRREMARERKRLGRLGDTLGAVRDHDVLDEYLTSYCAQTLQRPIEECPGLAQFEQFLQKERAQAFGPMQKQLKKAARPGRLREEFSRFALGLPAVQVQPLLLRGAAQLLLPWRVDEVLLHASALSDDDADVEHHELRKSLRRLRYTLEAFEPCFSTPIKSSVKILVQLQDDLGEMQDQSVLRERAHEAFETKRHDAASLPEDVARFLEHGESRRRELLDHARQTWAQQDKRGFFHSLRNSLT